MAQLEKKEDLSWARVLRFVSHPLPMFVLQTAGLSALREGLGSCRQYVVSRKGGVQCG